MRPLVYGYIRLRPTEDADASIIFTRELADYAAREGLTLADVFTERSAGGDQQLGRSAFLGMVETLRQSDVYGVVVPSLTHFSRFPRMCQAMCTLIKFETGARILVVHAPNEEGST